MDDNNDFTYGYDAAPEPELAPEPEPEAAPVPASPPPYAYNPQGYPPPPPPPAAYNPQAGAFYSTLPPPAYQPPLQPKPKKKRTGLVVFSVFALLALVVGIFAGIWVIRETDFLDNFDRPGIVQNDDSRLEIADTPTQSNTAAPGSVLTPVQIHTKLQKANVAVQTHSGRGLGSMTGEGSGILLHEDSSGTYTYVLTCAHVINSNERVGVELADGTSYDAAIVGYDNRTDVGLLRIKATGLQGAEFGDSDKLQVGEAVYAIGNPGGVKFKGSFTNGIVSAIDRPVKGSYTMQTIQHTAPINPGNSGGALLNAYGQVIGVNSQKIVDMQYEGMGFAIPSKVVQQVVNSLIAKGYVPDRPKLGIQYIAAADTQKGMLVLRINDLPAGSLIIAEIDEESGFVGTDVRINDIITHVNGEPLEESETLPETVKNSKVGDSLELTIARVGGNYSVESFDVSVKLVEDKGAAAPAQEATRPWYEDDEAEDPYGDYYDNYGYGLPPGWEDW